MICSLPRSLTLITHLTNNVILPSGDLCETKYWWSFLLNAEIKYA